MSVRLFRLARLVVLVAGMLSLLQTLAGCHPKSSCDLTVQLRQRAGAAAKDCGDATSDAGIAETDACVVSRFGKDEPFFAQYPRQGEGSQLTLGISSDGKGNVAFLEYDSDSSGSGSAAPVINGSICHDPLLDTSSDRDPTTTPPIKCTSMSSIGPTCSSVAMRR
jgi:hypothetical protein